MSDITADHTSTSPTYYEVFARQNSAEALTHLGSVEAPNDDLAEIRAWYVYDQHRWLEMCVVPSSSMIEVRPAPNNIIRIKPV